MKYVSTRGHSANQGFTDILLEGLGSDGGLMVPELWPRITRPKLDAMRDLAYPRLAFEILRFFADDFPGAELKGIVEKTYDAKVFGTPEITPLTTLEPNLHLLSLSNGPTLAFKDIAMQLLGPLFESVLERQGRRCRLIELPNDPPEPTSQELYAVRKRHAYWYGDFVEHMEQQLAGEDQESWLNEGDAERENIVAAIQWGFEHRIDPDLALRMCTAFCRYWHVRGLFFEGIEHTLKAVSRVPGRQDAMKLHALNRAGLLLAAIGDWERSQVAYKHAFALAEFIGNEPMQGAIMCNLGATLRDLGKLDEARLALEEAVQLCRAIGDERRLTSALCNLAATMLDLGELEVARHGLEQLDKALSENPDSYALAAVLCNWGDYYRANHRHAMAAEAYERAYWAYVKLHDPRSLAQVLRMVGELALSREEYKAAARLFGAAECVRDQCSIPIRPVDRQSAINAIERTKEALGESVFGVEWDHGRAMPMEETGLLLASLK